MTSDDRPTPGLILDVLDVLERHGYHRYDNRHTGQAIGAILDLAYVYDGTRDVSYGYYTPRASHAGAEPSGPGQTTRSSSPTPKSTPSSPHSTSPRTTSATAPPPAPAARTRPA